MSISPFYRALRERIGSSLLLVPSVAAIIRDSAGRVLLQQQHDDSWSLPAGAIEPGESPAIAVAREVLEETGLVVSPLRIAGVVGGASCRVRYQNGDEVEFVVTVFDCDVIAGALLDTNDETKRLAYYAMADLPRLAFGYPNGVFHREDSGAYFAR